MLLSIIHAHLSLLSFLHLQFSYSTPLISQVTPGNPNIFNSLAFFKFRNSSKNQLEQPLAAMPVDMKAQFFPQRGSKSF